MHFFSNSNGVSFQVVNRQWVFTSSLALWRHQMETFSVSPALCAANSPVPVNSLHKGQWRGALMFSLICAWINDCKQPLGWWFETPSWSLQRQCNGLGTYVQLSTEQLTSHFLNQGWPSSLTQICVILFRWVMQVVLAILPVSHNAALLAFRQSYAL